MISAKWIVIGIFLLMGVIFFGIGLLMHHINKSRMERCTLPVLGTVVDYERRVSSGIGSDHSSSVSYHPVLEYTVGNQQYRRTAPEGRGKPADPVDTRLRMLCDPNDPNDFYLESDKALRIVSIVFSIVGGLFLVAAWVLMLPVW